MAYVGSFAIGLGLVIAEACPTAFRGKILSMATSANWACNAILSWTFLDLVQRWGIEAVFFLFALLSFATVYYAERRVPESKGKVLL